MLLLVEGNLIAGRYIYELKNRFDLTGISCELLIGKIPNHKRKNIVERFQDGKFQVFLGSTKAGGVGLTLTNASNLILHDRPWKPGDAEQAEDRCHRIGQESTVNIYWPALGEIDKVIDSVLQSKSANIDVVLRGKNVLFNSSNLMDLQKQLLRYYEDEYGI